MSDLEKLRYYLGIEVTQHSDGITLSQARYVSKLVEEAGMGDRNSCQIPMELNVKMSRGLNEKHVGEKEYRRSIGCLRYLLLTRRDLSFVVGMLSRYMHEPRESHNVLLKQVLQYLRGTLSYGLSYERADGMRLIGYSDSSHNADADDGRSTTGHIFYLEKCPITWCSQKQETVDLSSCEAEFMAATEAAKQAIWLQDLLAEVTGSRCEKVTLRIDNKSAIALTKNPMFHGRRKEQTHTP